MEFFFNSILIPVAVAFAATKIFLKVLNRSPKIKNLVSTESVGDFVNVCFEMRDGSLRYFRVRLECIGSPNDVTDMQTFDTTYKAPFFGAARHAAEFHMRGNGKSKKVIHEPGDEWKLS